MGEEWLSGPYTVLGYCNSMMETLSKVEGKRHLDHALRTLPNGQVAATVLPHEHLGSSCCSAAWKVEVWMEPGVTQANLAANTAGTC